mgnify:CR=1 FL=1
MPTSSSLAAQLVPSLESRGVQVVGAVTFTPNNTVPTAAQQLVGVVGRDGAVGGTTPYEMRWRIPGYWFTRSEQAINSNTAFQLTAQAIYDQTLTYPFNVYSVGTRASL